MNRTQPYFFSFDSKSQPGKIVAHFVVVETLVMEVENFEETRFAILGADFDEDERIRTMFECIKRA